MGEGDFTVVFFRGTGFVYYGFLLAGVLAASFSQVLLKKGAMRSWPSLIREYLNVWVLGGYFLLVCSTVLNICGLRGLSFLNGPVMESFGYVLPTLPSPLFFCGTDHETETRRCGLYSGRDAALLSVAPAGRTGSAG